MEIFRGAVKMIKVHRAHIQWKRCKERLSEKKKRVTKSKRKRHRGRTKIERMVL